LKPWWKKFKFSLISLTCALSTRQIASSRMDIMEGYRDSCLGPSFSDVAIGNPERHVRKASHRGSKQQWRSPDEITLLLLVRATFIYFFLRAHPVRGESYNQRNTTGEVATQRYHATLFGDLHHCLVKTVMFHSRATFKEALKPSYVFQSKANLWENVPNEAAFNCSGAKLCKFLFLSYVYYALEFSS